MRKEVVKKIKRGAQLSASFYGLVNPSASAWDQV